MMRGFSLLETVVVIAISAVIVSALGFLIYTFNGTLAYQRAVVQSSGSASAILREVESLVFPASAVLGTHTFSGMTYTSSATTLVLQIPSIDSSGNAIANTYDYAVFYTAGANTYRLLAADTSSARVSGTKQLSSTLQNLTFSYDNSDFTQATIVTIDVTTQAQVKQTILTDHRHEQIRLRNK